MRYRHAVDERILANQRLWDRWTEIHAQSAFYDVASFLDGRDPIRLSPEERADVGPVEGRTLLHLQCHFGLDTLSWARLGAVVTGADLSPNAIALARELADRLDLPARFIQANLYDLPTHLDGTFDIVYTSRGVLGWLPDIRGWARVVARYVRPGGIFFITEIHPVALALADEGVGPGELRLGYPYWEHAESIRIEAQGSYADPTADTTGLVEHGWDHGLGEIVTALIEAGLVIELLREHDFCAWELPFLVRSDDGRWRLPPDAGGELPLFFSLRARKPG